MSMELTNSSEAIAQYDCDLYEGAPVRHTGSTTQPLGGEGTINAISRECPDGPLYRVADPRGMEHWFEPAGIKPLREGLGAV